MLRILFFVVLVFLLGLGFAWLADRPGDIVVTFAGYQYEATLMVAAVVIVVIVAAVMIAWWLVKSIWNSPQAVSRYFRVRRRDRGYQALSTGMIAAGAGDAALARSKKKEAMKLISADQEPLIHLLDAQASLLEGDHDAARRKFDAMLDDPEMRLLGLRGLYLEAERLGDRTAARHYAAKAAEAAPQLTWAADATLEERAARGEWDEALRLVEAQKASHQVDRARLERLRAVLLTAKAAEMFDADPAGARNAAQEAHRLAPALVPATVLAARAAIRMGDLRKGARILEAGWKAEPHPEIADAYVHARPGDSTHDRLDRAKKLRSIRTNNAESEIAVARSALEAGEFAIARQSAEAALRMSPREGLCLLMADIEEADGGDEGKVREWLGRALRAPADPAWVADGVVAERWAPVSPVDGRLDAFEWRAPMERLGQVLENFAAPTVSRAPLPAPTPEPVPPREPKRVEPLVATAAVAAPEVDDGAAVEAERVPTVRSTPDEPGKTHPAPAPDPVATEAPLSSKPTVAAAEKPKEDPASVLAGEPQAANDPGPAKTKAEPSVDEGTVAAAPSPRPAPASPSPAQATPPSQAEAEAETVILPPLPDDPGVEPDERPAEPARFRLF
jgi:HemY protein